MPVSEKQSEKIKKSFKIETVGDEIAYSVEIKGRRYFIICNQYFYETVYKLRQDELAKKWSSID